MRYLAIDYGDKRTGLAICDAEETIVSPLTVIHGQKDLLKKITDIVETEKVEAIVLGLPLNMDGSEGPQAKVTQNFAKQLERVLDVPIHFQDERLSSFEAESKLEAAQLTRRQKRKRMDAVAAAEILRSFLDAMKG